MLTFTQIVGVFNLFIGIMLATAILIFASGLTSYASRFGTWPSNRDESIKVMEWGVVVLFVLVVLVGVMQYFEKYPKTTGTILAVILILVIGSSILKVMQKSTEEKKK